MLTGEVEMEEVRATNLIVLTKELLDILNIEIKRANLREEENLTPLDPKLQILYEGFDNRFGGQMKEINQLIGKNLNATEHLRRELNRPDAKEIYPRFITLKTDYFSN